MVYQKTNSYMDNYSFKLQVKKKKKAKGYL